MTKTHSSVQFIKCHIVCPHCSKVGYIIKVIKGALMQLTPIASNMTEVETDSSKNFIFLSHTSGIRITERIRKN